MTRDFIKLYSSYNPIQENCLSCGKSTHILNICPFVNFIPDLYFIIKRLQFTKFQERNPYFQRKKKRRFNSLNDNNQILNKILLLDSSIFAEDASDDDSEVGDSSSSFRSVCSNKPYEEDFKKPNQNAAFPSTQSYLVENAKAETYEKLKLPNQIKQEDALFKQSSYEDQDEELLFNKGQNLRNPNFKRKNFKTMTIVKEKNSSQNFKKQSSFEKEELAEKKKKEADIFLLDFERSQKT